MMLHSCTIVCVDGDASFSVNASLTVVGKSRVCSVVLFAPLFMAMVARAC